MTWGWMIDTQLGRRNLPPAQRLAVTDKFKKKIQEQAKVRQSEAGKEFGNGKSSSSPNGEKQKNIHTDKELAKMVGVKPTLYKMDAKVINSNNEDIKQRVLSVLKAEKIDYARHLERIESLKAKERMSDGGKGVENLPRLKTDDFVAEKLGIGFRDTYCKEKFITENQEFLYILLLTIRCEKDFKGDLGC